MKRNIPSGAAAVVAALVVLLALPMTGAAGTNPVDHVVDNLRGAVNGLLGQGGGAAEQQDGGGGSSPRQASPGSGGYEPPLHGGNPHAMGSAATLDLAPESGRPLGRDPSGAGTGENAVVGRSRGEQTGRGGSYSGHVTILALFGNEILGTETQEGQNSNGPLGPINDLLDEICSGSGNNICLSVLRADSSTTSTSSFNSFEAVGVRLLDASGQGVTASAASSTGNIQEDGNCQSSDGSSRVANANVGGSVLATVSESHSSSRACNDRTGDVTQSSEVIGLGGTGVPIPAPGCANGTPNTLTGIPGLLPIVCNANDENGGVSLTQSQAGPPYGVREALTVFALDAGGTALLKATTAASESKATAQNPDRNGDNGDNGDDRDDGDRDGPRDGRRDDRGPGGAGGVGGAGDGGLLTAAGEGDAANAACEDGVDNDGDGKTDFGDDPECESPNDTSEADGRLAFTGGSLLLMLLVGLMTLAVGLRLRARTGSASS